MAVLAAYSLACHSPRQRQQPFRYLRLAPAYRGGSETDSAWEISCALQAPDCGPAETNPLLKFLGLDNLDSLHVARGQFRVVFHLCSSLNRREKFRRLSGHPLTS